MRKFVCESYYSNDSHVQEIIHSKWQDGVSGAPIAKVTSKFIVCDFVCIVMLKDNRRDINQKLEQLEAQSLAPQSQDMTTLLPYDQWHELQSTLAEYHNCLKDREKFYYNNDSYRTTSIAGWLLLIGPSSDS